MGDRPLLRSVSIEFKILGFQECYQLIQIPFQASILGCFLTILFFVRIWYEKKKKSMHPSEYLYEKCTLTMCCFTLLEFRPLRLCFTILNLREDKGEKSKAIVLDLIPRNRTGNSLKLIWRSNIVFGWNWVNKRNRTVLVKRRLNIVLN
jgi:hypothetical protein